MLRTNLHRIHIHALFEPALLGRNLHVVPAHLPLRVPPVGRKRPVLEPVAPLPLHPVVGVLVLVPELHRDLVAAFLKAEQFFPQAVVVLLAPFLGQEVDDGRGAGEEAVAVAPDAVFRVRFGDEFGVTGEVLDFGWVGFCSSYEMCGGWRTTHSMRW